MKRKKRDPSESSIDASEKQLLYVHLNYRVAFLTVKLLHG